MSPAEGVTVRRARIEEIRPLAAEYRAESAASSSTGEPWDPPLPQGGIFWLAEDSGSGDALGYVPRRVMMSLTPEGARPAAPA